MCTWYIGKACRTKMTTKLMGAFKSPSAAEAYYLPKHANTHQRPADDSSTCQSVAASPLQPMPTSSPLQV